MKRWLALSIIFLVGLTGCRKDDLKKANSTLTTYSDRYRLDSVAVDRICNDEMDEIILDIKDEPFSAVGDGEADDTEAFLKASRVINYLNSQNLDIRIILYIPNGVYQVGYQLLPMEQLAVDVEWDGQALPTHYIENDSYGLGATRFGVNIIDLRDCENVDIVGESPDLVKIRFKKELYFGTFDLALSASVFQYDDPLLNDHPEYGCSTGTGIYLENCKCITIQDIQLLGGNQFYNIGGMFNDGYQLNSDGIFIRSSDNVRINRVHSRNFGRDGLLLMRAGDGTSVPDNIDLRDSKFIYNSRQGFSWTAGQNVYADNCDFSSTGKIFHNKPGAGMDIEPQEVDDVCVNGTFINCRFVDNISYGMVCDNYNYHNIYGIWFAQCTFRGMSGTPVFAKNMQETDFFQCDIMGTMETVRGWDINDHLTFQGCTIRDDFWMGQQSFQTGYLLNLGSEDVFYLFNGCTFESRFQRLIYTVGGGTPPFYRTFSDNTFNFHTQDLVSAIPFSSDESQNSLGHFMNVNMDSNSFVDLTPVATGPVDPNKYWFGASVTGCNGLIISDGNNTILPWGTGAYTRVQRNPCASASAGSTPWTF